jgi:hypothetical protein
MPSENESIKLTRKALSVSRESKRVEFKGEVDPTSRGSWLEMAKDIAAMANSGGGVVIVGLDSVGSPTGWSPDVLLSADPATLVDSLAPYLGEQYDDFSVAEVSKDGVRLAAILIGARTGTPLIFEKSGNYQPESQPQRQAFGRGTVYFRHGAKSEPGLAKDLASFSRACPGNHLARTHRNGPDAHFRTQVSG